MHLAVDGYGGDPSKLQDVKLISSFLDEHPSAIGMTKIVPPLVYTTGERRPRTGVSPALFLIAESHVSIHTFPDRGYLSIDVFSCKEFDPSPSVDEVKAAFSLQEVRVWTIDRGPGFRGGPDPARGRPRLHPSLPSSDGLIAAAICPAESRSAGTPSWISRRPPGHWRPPASW